MFKNAVIASLLCLIALPALAEHAAAGAPKIGDQPPPMLGHDRQGNDINLNAMKGKVVVVTFWASWCTYCREELPVLSRIQKIVGRDRLQVIAVNFKQSREAFLGLVRANKDIDLTYVQDTRGKICDLYGVDGLPDLFIIAQDGKIVHHHVGYDHGVLQSIVDEIVSLLPADVLKSRSGGGA